MLQDILLFFLPFIFFFFIWFYSKKPTNNKNWREDLKILPQINIHNNTIEIKNVRDFKYGKNEFDYIKGYKNYKFNIDDIISLDYIIEPFMKWDAISHPLLSFGLKNGKPIVISVEVRKRKGEDYDPLRGALNFYELYYNIATEEDVIKLRIHKRGNPVYLFPIKADKNFIRNLFLDMIKRANKIQEFPEFYNTFSSSCVTNLIDHINHFLDNENKISKNPKTILPGYTKGLLFDLHYVLNGEEHPKDFKYYLINKKALNCTKNFSKCIRKDKESL